MIEDVDVARKYMSLYGNATERGIEFNLTLATVRRLLNTKKCYYTGRTLNGLREDPDKRSIDRVDNEKGYIEGNVVACSLLFNKRKSNLTLMEIQQMTKALRKK